MHEAHVPTQQSSSQAYPWFPEAHEHPGRPGSVETPPPEGKKKARRVSLRQSFTSDHRIRKRREYQRVYEYGRKASTKSFVLFCAPNDLGRPRLGLTVTKRCGGAVERNRIKRLLREWFRANTGALPSLDFVIHPRQGAHRMTLEQLSREMTAGIRRLAIPKGEG